MRRAKRATRRQEEEEVDREDCENFAAASPGRNLERPYRPAHAFFRIRGAFAATDFARGAEIGQAREGSGARRHDVFRCGTPGALDPFPGTTVSTRPRPRDPPESRGRRNPGGRKPSWSPGALLGTPWPVIALSGLRRGHARHPPKARAASSSPWRPLVRKPQIASEHLREQ